MSIPMKSSINRRTLALIQSAQDLLPEDEFLRLMEYVEFDEHGLALEHLCDILFELGLPCPSEMLGQIKQVGLAMKMEPSIWAKIEAGRDR